MKYCTKCGKELNEGADICLGCGTVINQNNTPAAIANKQSNVTGIIGFVCSIIGLFVMPLVLGIVGISLSSVGIKKAKTCQSGKGLSIAGLIVGIIDIVWWIITIILAAIGLALYY